MAKRVRRVNRRTFLQHGLTSMTSGAASLMLPTAQGEDKVSPLQTARAVGGGEPSLARSGQLEMFLDRISGAPINAGDRNQLIIRRIVSDLFRTIEVMPGDKLGDLFRRNMSQPYVLQRLTQRSYYVQRAFYSTTFYVGDTGVLLFDAPEGRGGHLLKAIREVTPLPVTTLVYSHFHVDHVGDAAFWINEARKAGVTLQIVATQATAEKMAFMNSRLPKPTLVLSKLTDSFTFDKVTVEVHRFAHPAHTDDHSVWLLKEEKVLHGPDLLNPDQLPMMGFAVSDTIVYHESNLREAAALDWDYFNGGHGNIGSKAGCRVPAHVPGRFMQVNAGSAATGAVCGAHETDGEQSCRVFPLSARRYHDARDRSDAAEVWSDVRL
jgi:glyoxylase-like metal-dependent hydrolase (beta-lactamase superfamily II)